MAFSEPLAGGRPARRFVCLVYHDVYAREDSASARLGRSATMYHVSAGAFREHLRAIQATGTRPLGIDALRRTLAAPRSPRTVPEARGVVVCFDDGWQGAVALAAPFLQELEIPALFFITTGFVGRRHFATAGDLRRLDRRVFTLGSHGATHRMLCSLSSAAIANELGTSKQRLEDLLGVPVTSLSIPGGGLDRRVVEIAKALGYREVFTSSIGINPTPGGRYDIARIGVTHSTSVATLERWLSFRLDRERWRKSLLALPKQLLGMQTYSKVRRVLLDRQGGEHTFEP